MLIVLDTNVLVSALLKRNGFPGKILDLILIDALQLALDERIINEYTEVLKRPRFQFPQGQVDSLLSFLKISSLWIERQPSEFLDKKIVDPGDLPFGEVAIHSHASVLITGNTKHFSFLRGYPVKVLLPQEFISEFVRNL